MAIVPYTSLVDEVQLEVLKAPYPTIVRAIRNAAIEFYTESESMVQNLDPITLVQAVNVYDLYPPDETRVGKMLTVKYKGQKLTPTSRELLNQTVRDWDTRQGTITQFFTERPNEVTVAPVPKQVEVNALDITVALIPSRKSLGIEEQFMESHYRGIIHGALMGLFSMDHQEWASPQRAQHEGMAFGQAVAAARARSRQDDTAKLRVMEYGGL